MKLVLVMMLLMAGVLVAGPLENELFDAVICGNYQRVRQALINGANANQKDPAGQSVLSIAFEKVIARGERNKLESMAVNPQTIPGLLIKHGADVSGVARYFEGQTNLTRIRICRAHLRALESALDMWLIENDLQPDDYPGFDVGRLQFLSHYLPDSKLPACPSGGRYQLKGNNSEGFFIS
ncbi:MAG: hypothetical protein PHQ23_00685, partial [Candidatus Wallbacteria bacterium]|nr:hypothetical protein [Candidatus Wallbacteria bacterium]